MGQNIYNVKKKTIFALVTSQKADLEVNAEKRKHIFVPHEENAGQQHKTKAANKSFENVAKLYFRTTLTHANCMHRSK